MARKTKAQVKTYWNGNINTNSAQSITGSVMNSGGVDIIDSVAWYDEAGTTVTTGSAQVGAGAAIGWSHTIRAANAWEQMIFPSSQTGRLNNFTWDGPTSKLSIAFPPTTFDNVDVLLTVMMAINVNATGSTLRTAEVTHAVNGTVNPNDAWQTSFISSKSSSAGLLQPLSYTWNGILNNHDDITVMIKSDTVGSLNGVRLWLTAQAIHKV